MRKLFVVEQSFYLESSGLVLLPGLPAHSPVKIGASVELRRPDASNINVTITGFELPSPNLSGSYPIALGKTLAKIDAPVGTEVWSTTTS